MTQRSTFRSVAELREIVGMEASKVLPTEDWATIPVPVRRDGAVVLLVMFCRGYGPPKQRVLKPPTHAMYLDGVTGAILHFGPTTAASLGIVDPLREVPGLNLAPIGDRLKKEARWFAITPDVWSAFAAGIPSTDPAVQPLAREYWSLFLEVTTTRPAPLYLQAAAEFFAWVKAGI